MKELEWVFGATALLLAAALLTSCYHYSDAAEVKESKEAGSCEWKAENSSPISIACDSYFRECVACFHPTRSTIQCETFNPLECEK